MVSLIRSCLRTRGLFLYDPSISYALQNASFNYCSSSLSSLFVSERGEETSHFVKPKFDHQDQNLDSAIDILVTKIRVGSSYNEVFQSLMGDQSCNRIPISHDLVQKLLFRFKDDWKSAFGVFRWAESRTGYEHTPEAYDSMVDILGKTKQMDQMSAFLEEMQKGGLVTLKTVGKAMRRFSGAGKWEEAVRLFDKLGTFQLERNTKSMNLLLDTLCKERKVEQAREIFMVLKSYISPDANTFNIFIHGWCKVNRVEEAYWTIQEMKGHGFPPCVISYSTIIKFYCCRSDFGKVYELLDEMETEEGCVPNVVTYTSVMSALAKAEKYEEAIRIAQRMKTIGCKPDTLFYNSLIHSLGRAGKSEEARHIFEVEMENAGILPNTSTYNSMIAMLCHQDEELKALNLLKKMEASSTVCKPDVQSYYPLLKACLRTGKTDSMLRQLLDEMVKKHNLSLDISAYKLLIHGLCKVNKTEWAYCLFEEMVVKDITPRYQTCRVLLDKVKLNQMDDAAEKIETVMRNL